MVWYNYKGKAITKGSKLNEVKKILTGLGSSKPKPRKLPIVKFYQRQHYDLRIKPTVDEEWALEQANRTQKIARGEEVPNEGGAFTVLRDQVSERLWNQESEDFREAVQEAADEDYKQRKEVAEKATENPETAEQYHL